MPAYSATSGDIIALSDVKAGALTMSVPLRDYDGTSTDPIQMFAYRDGFRTVAETIAFGMAGVPVDLYARADNDARTKIREGAHVVADALVEPHAGMTQYRLLEAIYLDRVLHDRWGVLMLPQVGGGVELVRLPGRWLSFEVDGLRRITRGILSKPGSDDKLFIPLDRLIFDVGYDPKDSADEMAGYPIARTLGAAATELDKGAAYRAALLAGGPKVPMYVYRPLEAPDWVKKPPGNQGPSGRERFTQDFKAFSAERAGQVPVFEDGMELRAAPQLDKDTVQYRETRLAAQIEFAIAMHVPPELVGYRQGNFSNIEALRQQLYIDTLGIKLYSARQAWNAGLRRGGYLQRGSEYVEENVAIRLAGNPELQASILQTQVGAPVRTVNEARRLLNLPPVDGGDELIVPLNVTKGGLASPTDTGPKTLALPKGRSHDRQPHVTREIESKATTPKAYLERIDTQRTRFEAELRAALAVTAKRALKALGSASAPAVAPEEALDLTIEQPHLRDAILPHAAALAGVGADIVLDRFNPDRDGFDPDVMLPWLEKASTNVAGQIIAGAVTSVALGLVSQAWRDDVEARLDSLVESGAEKWAGIITTSATSFGSHDAAKTSGLGQKTWIHVGGETSRPEHAAMDGETVGISELFSNGLRYPGDPSGGPEDNAQCNCRTEYSRAAE